MIIITGHMLTDPSLVQELAADLRANIAGTLKEDGCLGYAFAVDDAAAGSILVSERWRDEAALNAHFSTPAIAAILEKWGGKVEMDVRKYDATNERALTG